MRLLLIEDKKELCNLLQVLFRKNNIDMDISFDGEEGLMLALSGEYAVIILDIMLPSMSGVEILRNLRAYSITTPVLVLTAKETLEDKVCAFDYGADDYLVKPFEFNELLVRVRALTRRPSAFLQETITVGNTSINLKSYDVTMNGKLIKTSLNESKILEKLFIHIGNFVSKECILLIICGRNKDILSNNVEVYIHHLRKKFPPNQSGFIIETKHNLGYRLIRNS